MGDHLKQYHEDKELKGCKELKFSNGGQFFACSDSTEVLVFQFFTAKLVYKFDGHISTVKSLSWLDDDTGLASSAVDHKINFWKLSNEEKDNRNHILLEKSNANFLSMVLFKVEAEKGYKTVMFASGNNGNIYLMDGK